MNAWGANYAKAASSAISLQLLGIVVVNADHSGLQLSPVLSDVHVTV